MHKLIDYVCGELEDLERKVSKGSKLSANELQYADTLAHLKKDLMQTEDMSEKGSYNGRGYSDGSGYSRGYSDGNYGRGNYVRPDGSYRREIVENDAYSRGRSRDSMGRFTASDHALQEVRMLMNRTDDEQTRHELSKLLDTLEGRM